MNQHLKLIAWDRLEPDKGIPTGKRQIRRMTKAGQFPKPIKSTGVACNRMIYVEEEIDAWIAERIAARDAA